MKKVTKEKEVGLKMPSAFSVLILIILALFFITLGLSKNPNNMIKRPTIATVVMSPIAGFVDAIDVTLFVLVLGGFLGIVGKTKALEAGIGKIVKKLKGKELIMIPILMTLFSVGGSTYGMAEETIAFYALVVGAMMAAGFDAMVGAAVILLGSGVGVLGSTVNPFSVGVAIDTLKEAIPGIEINQAIIIVLGAVLWLTSLVISIVFVMRYAKKVKENKKASILSMEEKAASKKDFGKATEETFELTTKRKITLCIFATSFIVMILSLLPWWSFGVDIFAGRTNILVGCDFGDWYFQELSAWFLIVSIVIGIFYRLKEKEIVESFITGASDMMGVVLVIAVSRGISVIMADTGFGNFLLERAAIMLEGINGGLFTGMSYVIYIMLSFLIPSTSGLAGASMPIM